MLILQEQETHLKVYNFICDVRYPILANQSHQFLLFTEHEN